MAGKVVGMLVILISLALGIIKCATIMPKAKTSAVCVCSLMLFLIAILGTMLLSLGAQEFHWPPLVLMLWMPLNFLLILSSIALGIIGLSLYKKSRFNQGRAQAIWGLVLSSLCFLMILVVFAAGISKGISEGIAKSRGTPGKRVELPKYNCAVTPPAGWSSYNPGTTGLKAAPAAFRKFGPELYMMLVPEEVGGQLDEENYVKLVKKHIDSTFEARDEAEDVVTLSSGQFHRLTSVVRTPAISYELYYERWITKYGGMVWQIVLWGKLDSRTELQSEARRFAEQFQILDKTRPATLAGTVTDVSNPSLGFSTHLAGSGWNAGGAAMEQNPLIKFTAKRIFEGLAVIPLRFEDPAPDLEALTRGMLSILSFRVPLPDDAVSKPFQSPSGEGVEIATERELGGQRYTYILRIVRGERHGHLVAGWASAGNGNMEAVRAAMDKIELTSPVGDAPALTAEQKGAMRTVLNQIGLSLFNRKDFEEAANWFRQAFQKSSEDPTVLENEAMALESAGRIKEALDALESNASHFPKAQNLQTHRALLLARNGDSDAGSVQFIKSIGEGMKDETMMLQWLGILLQQNRQDLAENAVDVWIAKRPSINASEWQADVYADEGDNSRAVKTMEKLAADNPANESVAAKLGEILNGAGEYDRAAAVASKLLEDGKQNARALTILGWSQMGRKWYRDAKSSFESAAHLRPEDQRLKTAIRLASSAIGQGNNADLNHPIDPVPVPPEVAGELKGSETLALKTEGEPAVILSRSSGYAFEKGKPLRHTIRRKIKVLTQAGVNSFSTLEFPFDPVAERVFVNRLAVYDPSGKQTASGSLDDAFVRDLDTSVANNKKLLQVQAPGLKPGATVEVEITMEDRVMEPDFPFSPFLFAYLHPCAVDAVFVSGDTSRVKAVTAQSGEMKVIKKDGLLAWISRNEKAVAIEPLGVPLDTRVPALWLGSVGGDWGSVTKDYLSQISDRLKPDSAVTKAALETCSGLKDPHEKIIALAHRVQSEVNYKALEFGIRARRPNAAGDTLRQRFGDCKDHALLLCQFLRAAGVECSLALVNTSRHIQPALPSLDQFNHMVVYVPGLGNGWLVDATDKFLGLGLLPSEGLWESHALILDPAKPRLLAPQPPPSKDCADVQIHRTVTPVGKDWQVEESLTLTGYFASAMRMSLSGEAPTEQTRRVQELLASVGAAEIKEFHFENVDDLAHPAKLSMSYVVRNANKASAGKMSGALPALWERYYLTQSFVPDRRTPFVFRYPFHISSDVAVKVPSARNLGAMARKETGKFADWEMRPGAVASAGSNVSFEFRVHPGEFPADQYARFYEAWDSARRTWDAEVEWASR